MKLLAYISLPYESYQYDRIVQIAMFQNFGRSWVIYCHSREIGNILLLLLYYYHLEYIYIRKWRPGRDMVWVLVGVRGCVPRPTGYSLVTLFSLSVSVKDRPLHWILVRSQTYYPEHILVYGSREDSLLFCRGFRLFSVQLFRGGVGVSYEHRQVNLQ